MNTIADAFVVTKYLAGEILVVQGDMGDKLFVIKKVSIFLSDTVFCRGNVFCLGI